MKLSFNFPVTPQWFTQNKKKLQFFTKIHEKHVSLCIEMRIEIILKSK